MTTDTNAAMLQEYRRDIREIVKKLEHGYVADGADGEWISVRRHVLHEAIQAINNLSNDIAHIYGAYVSVTERTANPPAWPVASHEESSQGWTLGYEFLTKVEALSRNRTEYSTSMEATEQVLIAALEVLAVAPRAEPLTELFSRTTNCRINHEPPIKEPQP